MMQGSRESHLKDIHMYGMLAFENKLKYDASEIMVKLAFARI
jgi:P-type E1-E2 ATPase